MASGCLLHFRHSTASYPQRRRIGVKSADQRQNRALLMHPMSMLPTPQPIARRMHISPSARWKARRPGIPRGSGTCDFARKFPARFRKKRVIVAGDNDERVGCVTRSLVSRSGLKSLAFLGRRRDDRCSEQLRRREPDRFRQLAPRLPLAIRPRRHPAETISACAGKEKAPRRGSVPPSEPSEGEFSSRRTGRRSAHESMPLRMRTRRSRCSPDSPMRGRGKLPGAAHRFRSAMAAMTRRPPPTSV